MLDKSNIIVLTHEEVDCISSAIKAFISQVKTRIPQSKNRDEVIKNCEGLRDFIITVFAPKQA